MHPRSNAGNSRGFPMAWPVTAALLVGVAAGMALPRPFQSARAAQDPASQGPAQDPASQGPAQDPASQGPAPPAGQPAAPPGQPEQPADPGYPVPVPFPGAPAPVAAPEEDAESTEEPSPPVAVRTFEGPAAMVLNFVQADSADDFESSTRRLVEGLAASEDGEHQAQAAGWTMYRVTEPGPNNNTVYVWFLDPVVEDANYAVPQLLNEVYPAEVQQLYETYMQSFGIGQTPLNLEPVELVADPD